MKSRNETTSERTTAPASTRNGRDDVFVPTALRNVVTMTPRPRTAMNSRLRPVRFKKLERCDAGQVPDLFHGVDAVLGKAERAVQQEHDRDDQADHAVAVERVDVVAQVASDEGELGEG